MRQVLTINVRQIVASPYPALQRMLQSKRFTACLFHHLRVKLPEAFF